MLLGCSPAPSREMAEPAARPSATAAPGMRPMRLFDFVGAVAAVDPLDHGGLEALFGTPLVRQDGGTGANLYFTTYRLDRLAIDADHSAERIELREPIAGAGATAGPLLTMRIAGPCVTRETVRAAYPDLAVTSAPRPVARRTDDVVGNPGQPQGQLRLCRTRARLPRLADRGGALNPRPFPGAAAKLGGWQRTARTPRTPVSAAGPARWGTVTA
jgi:hypothetical protein